MNDKPFLMILWQWSLIVYDYENYYVVSFILIGLLDTCLINHPIIPNVSIDFLYEIVVCYVYTGSNKNIQRQILNTEMTQRVLYSANVIKITYRKYTISYNSFNLRLFCKSSLHSIENITFNRMKEWYLIFY